MTSKVCLGPCREMKPLIEFNRTGRKVWTGEPTDYRSWCKECESTRTSRNTNRMWVDGVYITFKDPRHTPGRYASWLDVDSGITTEDPATKELYPTTEAQDEFQRRLASIRADYVRLDTEYETANSIPTDRILYGYRDLFHPDGRYKLGETVELKGRNLEGTQTLQPDADGYVVHSRVFHNATKADIVRQEDKAFGLLGRMGCPRVPHQKTMNESEFVDNTTAQLIINVINKLADEWNAGL